MTKSRRQQYGLGSFVKKFTRPIKKVLKSPLAKAALLGGAGLGINKFGIPGMGGTGSGWVKRLLGSGIGQGLKKNLWTDRSFGEKGMLGLGLLAVGTPLWQKMMKTGPYQEFEEETEDWDIQPASMANLLARSKDYYQNYDPSLSNLSFMPGKEYVNPTFYSAKGGLAKLANGGGVAEAQAEQMLKMEYQKYRNQGGTMSYQQFKMAVLKQAQGQGPMAQGQQVPQMAAKGGRIGLKDGTKNIKSWPKWLQNLKYTMSDVIAGKGTDWRTGSEWYDKLSDEKIRDIIGGKTGKIYARDKGYLPKVLYDEPEEGRGYYFRAQGGRVGAQEGGLMDMGGMEKDYRQEGGFVPIGGEEKADDVPARLSKNEFVFTADAVRNAGGGDIDAGAQVMENVMKNLEEGGEISEESQGAQGMYNNMKQLETRIA